jgi:hypothetical protein
LSAPDLGGSGEFIPTETVQVANNTSITAVVKTWNSVTNELNVSNVTGEFKPGDTIEGLESGASYQIRIAEDDNTVNKYPDNEEIQLASTDGILDFSESNPFGNP